MKNWCETQLKNIANIVMGQSPKGNECNGNGYGTPLLNGPTEFGFSHPFPVQYTTDVKKRAKAGDLLFCVRGSTTGRMNWAEQEYAIGRGIAAIQSKEDGRLQPLIRAIVEYNLPRLLIAATGSTFPNVSRPQLEELTVILPEDLNKRYTLSDFFKFIDSKVFLLRRQSQTLENIAQTLFKRWFIDFEFPDKNGKPYKSSGGKMVESELGEIPEGWEIKSLDQIADFLNGLALQKYPPTGKDDLPVIKIRELRDGISNNTDYANSSIDKKYIIDNGDIIFSWSGSLLVNIWCYDKGALNQHLFKVSSSIFPKWFYWLWTKHYLKAFQIIAANKATTMGHIQRSHLSETLVVISDHANFRIMDKALSSIIDKIIINKIETQTLTKTRDTLLPKLMSGQIRVKKAYDK